MNAKTFNPPIGPDNPEFLPGTHIENDAQCDEPYPDASPGFPIAVCTRLPGHAGDHAYHEDDAGELMSLRWSDEP